MNPTVDGDASGSDSQRAIEQLTQQQNEDQAILSLTSGKKTAQTAGGRTLNVPKTLAENTVPGPSYNSAVTTGPPCQGGHCGIPVTPLDSILIHHNLASAQPPPGANISYPGTAHLGNNLNQMPGISQYRGTALNHGPFAIQTGAGAGSIRDKSRLYSYEYIADPTSNKRVRLMSSRGLNILRKYLNRSN